MSQQTSPFTRKALRLRAPQDAHSDELPPKAIRRACAQERNPNVHVPN
jgi:hypothetical protein